MLFIGEFKDFGETVRETEAIKKEKVQRLGRKREPNFRLIGRIK